MSEYTDPAREVREFYNQSADYEWERLERHVAEFEITRRVMDRYIKPGDTVLDAGGGPGRYSLYLARKGCGVTLLDLSDAHVAFALDKAREAGVRIRAVQGDAREADAIAGGLYDHVLVMGPLYHLLTEQDRQKAMESCLRVLKPGGLAFVSFISINGGIIYMMKHEPELLCSNPHETEFADLFARDCSYSGKAFTQAHFARWRDIEPFMERLGLIKVTMFGQEGLMAPCEPQLLAQPPEVVSRWLDLSERVCEREDLLCFSEHIMYIGRKPDA